MIVPIKSGFSSFVIYLTVVACSPVPTHNDHEVTPADTIPLRIAVPLPTKANDCLDGHHSPVSASVPIPYPPSVPFFPAPDTPPQTVLTPPPAPPFPLPRLPTLLPEPEIVPSSPAVVPVSHPCPSAFAAPSPALAQTPAQVPASPAPVPPPSPAALPEPPALIPLPPPAPVPVPAPPGPIPASASVPHPSAAFPALLPYVPSYAIKILPIITPIQLIRGLNGEDCAPSTIHLPQAKVPAVETSTPNYVEPETEAPTTSVYVAPPPPPPSALPLPELSQFLPPPSPEKLVQPAAEPVPSPPIFIEPAPLPLPPAPVASSPSLAPLPVQTYVPSFTPPPPPPPPPALAPPSVPASLTIPHDEPAPIPDPCFIPAPSAPVLAPAPAPTHVPVPAPAAIYAPAPQPIPVPQADPAFGPIVVPDVVLPQPHADTDCNEEPVVVAQNKLFYPTLLPGTPYTNVRVYK